MATRAAVNGVHLCLVQNWYWSVHARALMKWSESYNVVVVPLSGLGMEYSVVALNHGSLTGPVYFTELGAIKNKDTSASLRFRAGTGCHVAVGLPTEAGNELTIVISRFLHTAGGLDILQGIAQAKVRSVRIIHVRVVCYSKNWTKIKILHSITVQDCSRSREVGQSNVVPSLDRRTGRHFAVT